MTRFWTPPGYGHHASTQLNMHNRETSIKLVLEAIENGISESKAAIDYNIPRSTLYNRHAGRIDAHSSHTNQQRLWECKQNNVELLFLPAHSSHVLQPLERAACPNEQHHVTSINIKAKKRCQGMTLRGTSYHFGGTVFLEPCS